MIFILALTTAAIVFITFIDRRTIYSNDERGQQRKVKFGTASEPGAKK